MKKQLILSFVVVFMLAVFAPAVVSAMDSTVAVEMVEKEKKTEKKEKKSTAKSEKSGDCAKAKSCCDKKAASDCSSKSEKK